MAKRIEISLDELAKIKLPSETYKAILDTEIIITVRDLIELLEKRLKEEHRNKNNVRWDGTKIEFNIKTSIPFKIKKKAIFWVSIFISGLVAFIRIAEIIKPLIK